ncbi:MAG: beta strand repeat-containing protein, partial [Candidatus Kariarchaeaceae archaeon]
IEGTNVTLTIVDDAAGEEVDITITSTAGGGSPLTTKGDVYGYDTADQRIPVGTNNHVFMADSVQALGVKYALIADANIDASAAIAFSKLATLTSGNILVGSAGNVATSVSMGGDVAIIAAGTTTIQNNVVTFAKMQDITTDRLLGRDTAATGDPEEISLNSTLEFTGAAAIQRAALTGDVTASAGSNTTVVANVPVGALPATVVLNDQANTYSGAGLQDFAGSALDNVASITSNAADPADAGFLRLGNAEIIAWEAAPAGTDGTITYSSDENFDFNNDIVITTQDVQANFVLYDNVVTPADSTVVNEIFFRTDSDTTEAVTFASIEIVTGDVTHATRSALMRLQVADDGVPISYIELDGEGQTVDLLKETDLGGNKLSNIGTTTITDLTEEVAPTTGDFLLAYEATSGQMRKVDVGNLPTGGGGEANTISSQGGGTFALTAATPKSGVDLRVISVSNGDGMNASLAADVLTLAVASTVVQTDQANVYGDFLQTFKDNQIKINSPDDADGVTLVNSNQTADRNLTIPVLTGDRSFVVTGEASQITIGTEVTGSSLNLSDTANIAYLNTTNDWGGLDNTNFGTVQADTIEVINAGAGTNPSLTSNSATNNLLLVNDQLAINNVGAGADPVFFSNDAGQVLDLTGSLDISGTLTAGTYAGQSSIDTVGTITTGVWNGTDIAFANIAQIATASILGRVTAATGDIEVLTGTQATTLLDVFTDALKGLVPLSGGGTTNYLRADGTWNEPPGTGGSPPFADTNSIVEGSADNTKELRFEVDGNTTGIIGVIATVFTTAKTVTIPDATDTLMGKATTDVMTNKTFDADGTGNSITNIENADIKAAAAIAFSKLEAMTSGNILVGSAGNVPTEVTMSGDVFIIASGATTIQNNVVTFAKMQDIATDRLLGRDTAATGDVEELTVGGNLEFTGAGGIQRGALTGDVTASAGSGATTVANVPDGALSANVVLVNQTNVFGAFLQNFAGATMRIPLSATPSMAVDGDFAIDTDLGVDWSHGFIKYFDGEELVAVAMPVAQFTTPTDGHVIAYNATNDEFELVAQSGGGGYDTIEEEGTPLTQRTNLNFIGAIVTAADNNPDTDVTVGGSKANFDSALSDGTFAFINQANVFTENQKITKATATAFQLERTGNLISNSVIGDIDFIAEDNGASPDTYASITGIMELDDATEEGSLQITVMEGGVSGTKYIHFNDAGLNDIDILRPLDISATAWIELGATPASSGDIRLANDTSISWRDAGNTADHFLKLNTDDRFEFDRPVRIVDTISRGFQVERTGELGNGDIIGANSFFAEDGEVSPVVQPYVRMVGLMEDDTAGAEEGSLRLEVMEGGTINIPYIQLNNSGANIIDFLRPLTIDVGAVNSDITLGGNNTLADTATIGQINFNATEDIGGTPIEGTYGTIEVEMTADDTGAEIATMKTFLYSNGTFRQQTQTNQGIHRLYNQNAVESYRFHQSTGLGFLEGNGKISFDQLNAGTGTMTIVGTLASNALTYTVPSGDVHDFIVNVTTPLSIAETLVTSAVNVELSDNDILGVDNIVADSNVEHNWDIGRSAVLVNDTPIGNIRYRAFDGGGVALDTYVQLVGTMEDDTNTLEQGSYKIQVMRNGSLVDFMTFNDNSTNTIALGRPISANGNAINMSTGKVDFTTGFIEFGTTPALSQDIRFENATGIAWRNAGNTADESLTLSAADEFEFSNTVKIINTGVGFQIDTESTLADGTVIGTNAWRAFDGVGVSQAYGSIRVIMESDVDTLEEGSMDLRVMEAGNQNSIFMTINDQGSGNIDIFRPLDLGTTFITFGTTPADAGDIRLESVGDIAWRNNADDGNITISKNFNDIIVFGSDIRISRIDATPDQSLYLDQTTPTDNTVVGQYKFRSDTDTTAVVQYAEVRGSTGDVTNATSSGKLELRVRDDNLMRTYLIADGEAQNVVIEPDFVKGLEVAVGVSDATETNVVVGAANALALGTADGFLYIPGGAGTPSGTPTAFTGKTAMFYDTTNNILYANDGGGWSNVGAGGSEVFTWTNNHDTGGFALTFTSDTTDPAAATPYINYDSVDGEMKFNLPTNHDFRIFENDVEFVEINPAWIQLRTVAGTGVFRNYRDDAVPADADVLGRWNVIGNTDTVSTGVTFGDIRVFIGDATNATASGQMNLRVREDNVALTYLELDGEAETIILSRATTIPTLTKLFLDGGGDTSIRESGTDILTFEAGGGDSIDVFSSRVNINTSTAIIDSGADNNRLLIETPEVANNKARLDFEITGTVTPTSSTNIASVTGFINQATPSLLQGSLNFWANSGDQSRIGMTVTHNREVAIVTGKKLYFDGADLSTTQLVGGDTSIRESSADIVMIEAGGTDVLSISGNGLIFPSSLSAPASSTAHLLWQATTGMIMNAPSGDFIDLQIASASSFRIFGSSITSFEPIDLLNNQLDFSTDGHSINPGALDLTIDVGQAGDNIILSSAGTTRTRFSGTASMFMLEKITADADIANFGQLWVLNTAPNAAMFTDDTGIDSNLTRGVHDIPISAQSMFAPTLEPATGLTSINFATNDIDYKVWEFTSTIANERVQIQLDSLPRNINLADIDVVLSWSFASGSGVVRWGIRATSIPDNGALDVGWGAAVEVNDTAGTANQLQRVSLAALAVGGTPAEGDTIQFEIYREGADVGDTFTGTARLHGITLQVRKTRASSVI